jgi:hypothetical protein
MEINKTVLLISLVTIIFVGVGNMLEAYYFINRAINLIEKQAPPLTLSDGQINKLKKIVGFENDK